MTVKKWVEKLWSNRPLKEILIELYLEKDMTIPQVADELGVSVGIVHKWLKENGIDKHKNLWTNFEHFG